MRRHLAIFLAVLCSSAFAEPAKLCPATQLSQERVILSTNMGDMVLALYPGVAPSHVQQILKLVRLGVYDTTHFYRVNLGFAIQLSGVGRRSRPITKEQFAAIHALKAEFNGCPHLHGTVTMAHDPGKPDSAQTSFLILLSDVPQMNGKFTVVGEVTGGMDVLDSIGMVPVDPATSQPLRRVEVRQATVASNAQALASIALQPAVRAPTALDEELPAIYVPIAFFLLASGVFLSLLSWIWPWRWCRAIGLLLLLVGYFQFFVILAPDSARTPLVAVALFGSSLLLFKLLTYFERGARS